MIYIIIAVFALLAQGILAAPLENGYALAPNASATSDEKEAAYQEARYRLLAAAGKYEHTPYRYGGIDKKGLDCSGFVYLSFLDALEIQVPRTTDGLYAWVEKITLEEAQPGDLVFFKTAGGKKISHVGILTGNGRFIHAASEGRKTGVIYSSLNEKYWARAYTGAGRALPSTEAAGSAGGGGALLTNAKNGYKERGLLIGAAAAPTWSLSFTSGKVIRGVASHLRAGAVVRPFNKQMILGAELRPEWDSALGVIRLPFTLSWGLDDKLRLFAGPALSFGSAALLVSGKTRAYTGGTTWFGAAGLTIAPFALKIASTDLAPYGEIAWQSYTNKSSDKNFSADFAAGFRFSTGLRLTWHI